MRLSLKPVMLPAVPLKPLVLIKLAVLMVSGLVWLKRLNASPRNCRCIASVMFTFFFSRSWKRKQIYDG